MIVGKVIEDDTDGVGHHTNLSKGQVVAAAEERIGSGFVLVDLDARELPRFDKQLADIGVVEAGETRTPASVSGLGAVGPADVFDVDVGDGLVEGKKGMAGIICRSAQSSFLAEISHENDGATWPVF